MKKINLLLLGICSLLSINACKNNNISTSSPSNIQSSTTINSSSSTFSNSSSISSINETITGVEIIGPTSVLIGKTIRLTADVLGSNNDDVIWTSSDDSIATVSNDGTVSGLSEGSVDIIATSVKDSTKSNNYTISVTLPKAQGISLFIEDNENISYDDEKDIYTVYLGQTFYIDASFFPNETKQPDITYSINYPSGSSENSVSLEIIPETTRAKVIPYAIYDGLVITATGKYSDLATQALVSSIEIDVVDKNIEEYTQIKEIVNSFKETESQELISSKLTRTKTTSSDESSIKVQQELTHNSYLNSTYVDKNIKTYVNNNLDNEETIHYYQGKNTINSKDYYYTFEYDENNNITNFFDSTRNDDEIGLIFDVSSSTYGYSSILNNILSSDTNLYEGDIASFGNTYVYAYTEFEINSSSFKLTSTCFDEDYDINYTLNLEVNFTSKTLNSYTFRETINNGTSIIEYCESATDLVYDTKVIDSEINNEKYLNLDQYYVEDFELVLFNEKVEGKYDYTNLDKYGAIETEENGLVKYVTSYDKTIIIKANALTPTTANINFDNIQAISSDTTQIPNVTSIADGIFAINALKDDDSNSLPGKATFTFTSSKGVQKQIIIEFVETTLEGVQVDATNATTYNEENDIYTFESIFEGEYSNYFFINAIPDESKYTFDIEIISGNENGISLIKHSVDNEYGYPDYSHSIIGNTPGIYQFKIYIVGHEYIESEETFEIEIKKVYTKELIVQNIVGETYEYYGSTTTYSFKFTTETQLDYSEKFLGEVKSTSFNYHIEDGAIIVDETQNFLDGMYFSRLSKGKILFNDDFSVITPYIEISDSSALTGIDRFTYYFDFKHLFDISTIESVGSYINGKTFEGDYSILSVSFVDGKGTLTFKNYAGDINAVFTFDYIFDDETNNLTITESSSSNTLYQLVNESCGFDYYSLEFYFKIQTNSAYPYSDTYKISIN